MRIHTLYVTVTIERILAKTEIPASPDLDNRDTNLGFAPLLSNIPLDVTRKG